MAISHIGGKTIVTAEDETTEADVCNAFYDIAKDYVLSNGDWPFARKNALLARVSANPTPDWAFSYQYPSDCLKAIYIPRTDGNSSTYLTVNRQDVGRREYLEYEPFEIFYGASMYEIYTNHSSPRLIYTSNITSETGRFPVSFVLALSYYLSALIAPTVVGAENFEIVNLMHQRAEVEISRSIGKQANEENKAITHESGFTRSRS